MAALTEATGLSTAALLGVGALIAVQLALQVTALVHLARTPAERVALGGRKVIWVLIIVLGEIVGPIVWFAAGRTQAAVADPLASRSAEAGVAPDASGASSAVDSLFGEPKR